MKIVSALTLSPAESTSSVPVAEPSDGISAGLVSTTAVRSGWSCLASVGAPGLGTWRHRVPRLLALGRMAADVSVQREEWSLGRREEFSEAETAVAVVYRSDCGRAARGVVGCPGDRGVLCGRLLPAGDLPRPLGRPESGWGTGCAQRAGSDHTDLRRCVPVPLAAGTEEGSERARRAGRERRGRALSPEATARHVAMGKLVDAEPLR